MSKPAESTPVSVLHVDDSAANRHRRRRVMEAAGFRVIEAESAAQAQDVLSREPVDLLLLDVRLPDGNGFDLTAKVKTAALAEQQDLAIVLISSYFTESSYRVHGLEAGADAYLIEPITDAELTATLVAVARRLAQLKEARANARLLDAIFEYVPEGITVADAPDITIRRVSDFGGRLLGRATDTLEGIPGSEHADTWAIYAPDGTSPARPEDLPLTRAASTGAVIADEEWIVRRADGQRITVLCNAGPIRDAHGRITGGIIAWRDITARKVTEEALVRLTEELTLADQTKNDFLATVVHELRQPIQAALAGLGVMKTRRDRDAGERARAVVERQLVQMARLTEDLLDATRIVRGEISLQLERHDLRAVLRESLETTHAAVLEAGLTLTTDLPPEAVILDADARRLQQVFVNLLSNAIRYTPSGGEVHVRIAAGEGGAFVTVRDTGSGIAHDRLPRIFDLFVRGTEGPQGFGIGLAVARSIVHAHGGTIQATSDGPGCGAEFVVALPATRSN